MGENLFAAKIYKKSKEKVKYSNLHKNKQVLDFVIKILLLLKQSIVGDLHITRKQYLNGSIPTDNMLPEVDFCKIEQGTHDELMTRKDYYYNLYTKNMIF